MKKQKKLSRLSKAEASARDLVNEIIEGQEKPKKRRVELEERRLQQEEKLAAEERERDRVSGATMTDMLRMMTQYMAQQSAFFPPFPMEFQQPGSPQPVPPYLPGYPPMPYGPPVTTGVPAMTTTQDSTSEEEN